jgi:ParB family transcriptional regulator, chromosome partitioning protein
MNQQLKPSPLGRGLSALFGDADASYAPPRPASSAPAAPAPDAPPSHLAITWLQPGAYQPRRNFNEEALKGLAGSIKERGVLEPLIVRPIAGHKDSYEIIAGERRWRAAQMAGLHEVPVVVRTLTDREALEFGLIENIQRQDLSPLEEAEGYKRLIDEFKYTHEGLAKIIGKSKPHIGNTLRLLTLPNPVKQMIESGDLSAGHARTLITAHDPIKLAEAIVKKGMSVRQAEDLARRELVIQKDAAENPEKEKIKNQADFAVSALEKDLERIIGLKVKIVPKGRAGTFTLYYQDLDQLDMVIKRLKGG